MIQKKDGSSSDEDSQAARVWGQAKEWAKLAEQETEIGEYH